MQGGFRTDINGLRALAVGLVVLFHFQVPGFTGGYAGVDVFFVISGYLMFGILERGLRAGSLSIWSFYVARFRRIAPALVALALALMALGLLCLPAVDLKALSDEAIAATLFVSNIKYWRETGYFDVAAQFKWFLHTWSLSVEWQFYMLLPLFVVAVHRLVAWRYRGWSVCLLILVVSLVLSLYVGRDRPTANFYLLPTRAWEMAAGGLAFYATPLLADRGALRTRVAIAGLAAIVAFGLLVGEGLVWPNAWTLVPVAGTACVLWAGQGTERVLDARWLQWLGSRSYSIYLWHWPVVVALGYLHEPDPLWIATLGIALSAVLGHLSYTLVEQPFHAPSSAVRRWPLSWALVGLALAVGGGATVSLRDGLSGRLPANIDMVFNASQDKNPRRDECHKQGRAKVPECTYGGPRLGVIVLGDSHAASVIRSVEKALPDPELHVLDWTLSSCYTVFDVRAALPTDRDYSCGAFVRQAFEKQKTFPPEVPLLIVNRATALMNGPGLNELRAGADPAPRFFVGERRPAGYDGAHKAAVAAGIVETACAFQRYRQVYLLAPIPEMPADVPRTIGRALLTGHRVDVGLPLSDYMARTSEVRAAQAKAAASCGVKVLDVGQVLCASGVCQGTDATGIPNYYDDDHLSEHGAVALKPLFSAMWATGARPHGQPDRSEFIDER